MTEHHGLDIARLTSPTAAHSVFAPSSSAGWLVCQDYILANLGKPDDAGYDAAYGTVGHEVAEEWLLRIDEQRDGLVPITEEMITRCRPDYLIGRSRQVVELLGTFDIAIDEEMLAYVAQYIVWCTELPGEHYIERRVDFSRLTPIPNQKGTMDHGAATHATESEPATLIGTDLKMGASPRNIVYAAEFDADARTVIDGRPNGNPQVLLYMLGLFWELDEQYHFEKVIIRIAQPRLDHFHVWETTREELLLFAEYVKERAHLAWAKDRTRTPSEKGCRWCKVRGSCAALVAWTEEALEGMFDDMTGSDALTEYEWTGEDGPESDVLVMKPRSYGGAEMAAVSKTIDTTWKVQPRDPGSLTTAQMAAILPMRSTVEAFFNAVEQELTIRAKQGEQVPGHVLKDGKQGNREFRKKADQVAMIDDLEFVGLEGDEVWNKTLVSPAQASEKLRLKYRIPAKQADTLLAALVDRKPGRQVLAPISDRRPEAEDLGERFEVFGEEDI